MARTWPKLRNRCQSAVDSPRLQLWALESTEIPGEPDPSWADHRHVTAGTAWPELHGEREVIQLAAASRSWVVILASFLGTDPLKYGEHMGQYSYIRIVHLF